MVFGGSHSFRCLRINSHVFVSRNILIGTSTLLVILLAFIFHPLYVKPNAMKVGATSGTATPSTTSLALTTESNTANIELALNSANGTFASSSTNTSATFTVSTNNYSGYTLSISADDDTGKLVHATNEDYYMDSISSTTSKTDFSADTTSAATSYNGKWGILPSTYVANNTTITNTGANPVFLPAPTTTPITLSKTSTANSIDNNAQDADTYTLGLGARASMSTVAGTYEKDINLITIANPIPYTITFNKNTEDTVTDMPANIDAVTDSTTITLPGDVPERDSHLFIGWCSMQTVIVDSSDTCSGTVYNPNGDGTNLEYGIDQTSTSGQVLYAMWEHIIYIQNVDLEWLNTAMSNAGDTAILYDKRDNEKYTVGKLEDGQFWLLDNLRLDLTDATVQGKLNSTTTNASNASLSYLINGGGTTADRYATSSVIEWDTNYSYSVPYVSTTRKNTTGTGGYEAGEYGMHYNYCAASAGSYCYGNGGTWGSPSGVAMEDICPKGWRLPTGGDNGEYENLYAAYSSDHNSFINALHVSLSGFVGINLSASYMGTHAQYWTSTYNSLQQMHSFDVTKTDAANNGAQRRYTGLSVRCVFGKTMQTTTNRDLESSIPNTGDTISLIDVRDSKKYNVTKISDGNYWMTTNLDLAGGTTLTANDSNIADNTTYTLPASSTSGFDDNSAANVYNSGSTTCSNDSPCYSYYNYAAATAGTNPSSGNATYDICPKGWRLPTGTEYTALIGIYTSLNTLTATPWSGALTGLYGESTFAQSGSGRYWTSTSDSASKAYDMLYYTSTVSVSSDYKLLGIGVRCVKIQPMQSQSEANLAAALPNVGDTARYEDYRDGSIYSVTKIEDDNYWMTTNLDLAGGTKLYSETSNVPDGYSESSGTAYYQLPQSTMAGFDDNAAASVYNTGRTICGNNSPCYSYYSYVAAAAGNNPSSGNTPYDICPKGWRLPTGEEFAELVSIYTTGNLLSSGPWNGNYNGRTFAGSFATGGNNGQFRSATAVNQNQVQQLLFDSGSATLHINNKRPGQGVRCVKKMIIMQKATVAQLSGIMPNSGDSADAIDKRDNRKYSIANIGGTYWMTTNLDLAGGTKLYSDTSNVPDGYPESSGTEFYQLPASSTSGFNDAAVANVYNSSSTTCGNNSPCYSYYNYAAATAGTNPSSMEAIYDVCPKGWRLPTREENITIKGTYNSGNALTSAPWYGVYGGYYGNGLFYNGGQNGYYWSSAAYDETYAHVLNFNSTTVVANAVGKDLGRSVRCMIKNPVAYSIAYNKNTEDAVTDMPSTQSGTDDIGIALSAATPIREGYTFKGWCSIVPSGDTCFGTTYSPGATHYLNHTAPANNTITLYAMWEQLFTITLSRTGGAASIIVDGTSYTGGSIQLASGTYNISGTYDSNYEFSSWAGASGVSVASTSTASTTMTVSGAGTLTLNGKQSCISTVSGTMQAFSDSTAYCSDASGTLTDSRGGSSKSYTVAKIDGLWWMTRNLDLPGGTTLTPSDSNVASNYTLPASRTSTNGGVTLDGGFDNTAVADVYNSGSTTCASRSPCYSYYSYAAATAGTNPRSDNATSDICPKGWRLPTQAELTTLKNTYTTGATLTAAPFNGVYAGGYGSSFYDGGSSGTYWSSTAKNASYAYVLILKSSNAYVDDYYKGYGYSIRCVAK